MFKKTRLVKKFVKENKTKFWMYTALTSTVMAAIFRSGLKDHDNFLKSKGLYDEYYTPED